MNYKNKYYSISFQQFESIFKAKWQDRTNAFQYAAGFVGALEFLQLKVIPHCNQLKSFALDTIKELIEMEPDDLILQAEIKGVGGKDAPRKIYERLVEIFRPATPQNTEFRI